MTIVRFDPDRNRLPLRAGTASRVANELRYLRGEVLGRLHTAQRRLAGMQITRHARVTGASGLESTIADLRDALRIAHELAERISRVNAP
jgi:hypothetical protein